MTVGLSLVSSRASTVKPQRHSNLKLCVKGKLTENARKNTFSLIFQCGNMSFKVVHTWELPPDPSQPPPEQVKSGLFHNGKYAWWTRGSYLEVRQLAPLITLSSRDFGGVPRDAEVRITCVAELPRDQTSLPLLVVALHCPVTAGLICVFDCFASTVVRAVRLEHYVTQMHVIDPGCTGCTLPPDSPLKYLDGVLALGTLGGDVMLLDLYKQACDNSIGDLDRSVKDELNPSTVTVVRKDKMADIKKYIEKSVDRDRHVGVYLNDTPPQAERGEHFTLKNAEGEEIVHVDRSELEVSALYYSPQLGCLLVGYNFGAFQMWDLRNLKLRYTSPICEDNIPITGFTVQEPADDPKAYCYVWVAYSHAHLYQRGLPFAVLYSFYFDRKNPHPNGWGNLYENFQHCSVRFQLELGDARAALKSARGGAFLHFQPVNRDVNGLSLCQMSWWYWTASREGSTGVLVFDLNQWYKEQMPRVPNWNRCSNYMIQNGVEGLLLDVKMDEKSLVQFMGVQRLEEHFCPTALSFDLWGVSHDAILKIHNKSVQKEFLDTIAASQHLALLRPENLLEQITNLGLVPLFYDLRNSTSLDQDAERELLFAVALEHNMIEWIGRAVVKMADDSLKSVDLRASDVLRWAFKRACAVKNALHAFCAPLFDLSGAILDENTLNLIGHGVTQIRHVTTVYRHVANKMADLVVDQDEFVAEQRSLENLVVYFETLLWMTNVGLLPERHSVNADDVTSATYPVGELTNYYQKRRAHLQLSADVTFAERDCLLFIDSLINHMEGADVLRQQWQEDGGAGLYPPPSLQSVLRTYLLDGPSLRHKHILVVYVLLDLAHSMPDDDYKVAKLLKFPQRFDLSQSDAKIAQAFWYLDRARHEDAVDAILDASIDDLTQWQHRVMLTSLLADSRAALALLYWRVRKPPARDSRDLLCHVTLLIARDLIDEAFATRQRRNGRDERALLSRIFGECARNDRLRALLYRRLNETEERAFFRFLEENDEEELRVVYCLMRARFLEAFEVASRRPPLDSLGLHRQQTASVTDSVLKLFKQLLPDVNRALVEVVQRERGNLWRVRARPAPFSVFVHDARARVRYKSSVHFAALSKANATFDADKMAATKIVTETTPFLKTPTAFRTRPEKETPILRTTVIEQDAEDDAGPTPRKRIKLSPRASVKSTTTNRSSNLLLSADAQSTLSTPIIRRKRASHDNGGVATPPASILKARHVTDGRHDVDDASMQEECENSLRTPLKARVKFDVSSFDASSAQESGTTPTTSMEVTDDDAFYSPETSTGPAPSSVDDVRVFEDSPSVVADNDDVTTEPPVKFDSPRSRRSYKRSFTETSSSPVRSSPRLSASAALSQSPRGRMRISSTVVENVIVTEETLTTSFVLSEISESDISGLVTTSAESSMTETNDGSVLRVRGRRSTRKSLTRAVLEHNAYALLRNDAPPPSLITSPSDLTEDASKMATDVDAAPSLFSQSESNISESDLTTPKMTSVNSTQDAAPSLFFQSDLKVTTPKMTSVSSTQDAAPSLFSQSDSMMTTPKMTSDAIEDDVKEDHHVTSQAASDVIGCAVYDDLSSASEDAQIVMEQLRDETSTADETTRDHARFLTDTLDVSRRDGEQAEVIEINSSDDDNVSNRNASSSGTSSSFSSSDSRQTDDDLDEVNYDELPELEVNVIEEPTTSEDGEPIETRSISVQCALTPTQNDDASPAVPLRLRTVKKTYGRKESQTPTKTEEADDRNVVESPDVLRLRSVRKTYAARKPDVEESESRDRDVTEEAARVTRRLSKTLGQLQGDSEKRQTRRILRDSDLGEALLQADEAETASEQAKTDKKSTLTRKKVAGDLEQVHVTLEPSKRGRSQSVDHTIPAARGRYSRSKSVDVDSNEPVHGTKPKSERKKASKPLSEMGDYATSRRLTRRQASMLSTINPDRKLPIVDEIDPIDLLDKSDFQGKKDVEESKLMQLSPSTSSEASSKRTRPKGRSTRSATPTVVSGIKSRLRRTSTDTASVASERSEATPSPPKRAKTRARSVSSAKSSASQKRSTRSRKLTEDLPAVEEEAEAANSATQADRAAAKKRGRK